MTRQELLDLICPTDVPKECEDGKSNCDICFGAMNRWLDKYDKRIRADAETEHDKMCETCIHKVNKEDIDYLLELEAKRVKHETLKPIKDLLNSNVSQIHLRRKLEEILNEVD